MSGGDRGGSLNEPPAADSFRIEMPQALA